MFLLKNKFNVIDQLKIQTNFDLSINPISIIFAIAPFHFCYQKINILRMNTRLLIFSKLSNDDY